MESEQPVTGPAYAAERLQGYAQVRARVERRGPSRAYAALQLWLALAMAAYAGALLISFAGNPPGDTATGAGTYSSGLLVFPVLLLSSLGSGARERFSIRTKPSPSYWVGYALIIGGFSALLAASVAGVAYPWWATLLVPVVLFVVMAASPIRQLSRRGGCDVEQWRNEPLSRPVRRTTVLIGVAIALLAATSTQWWFPITSMATMLLLIVVLIGWRADWGLPRTGYEWGPMHWAAFGIVISVLFTLSVLLSNTGWITTPISITAGTLALLIMLFTAFLPRRPGRS
jgi:hypothetical protein